MSLRAKLGGPIEAALIKAFRDNVKKVANGQLREKAHKVLDELFDKYIGDKLDGLADKFVANVIDQVDGEDDIPNV